MTEYTVTRGSAYDGMYPAYYANALLDPTSEAILILAKEIKSSGQNHYGGTFYSLKFMVDNEISVEGLSFWGPITEEHAAYNVQIRVYEPVKKEIFPVSATRNEKVNLNQHVKNAEKNKTFKVAFDLPLQVKPNTWYMIQFKLEGPDTVRCRRTVLNESVLTDKGVINFRFSEGTRQLPQIHFTVN